MTYDHKGVVVIEGHVQGLSNTQSFGEMGVPVIVIDKDNCIARYSKYCIKFFKCPDYFSQEFIQFIMDLGKREKLEGWSLIPSNDHIVYNLSMNKGTIAKIYKTMVPEFDALTNLYDKYNFLNINKNVGIPVPTTLLAADNDLKKLFVFPALIKGREGLTFYKKTGKKGIVVEDQKALEKTVKDLSEKIEPNKILIQELIPFNDSTDIWSFCTFALNGDTKAFWIGKKLREHPSKFGTATLAMSDYEEKIENYGKKVISTLGYSGPCEIEFVKDRRDNTFKLIEMNPRTWLWVGLARYCGIDIAKYIYCHLNNISIDYPLDYIKNVKWMNFWTDLFFSVKAIINNDLTIKEYLHQNKGELIQAVYSKNDIMPFVLMTLLLPYIALKRI